MNFQSDKSSFSKLIEARRKYLIKIKIGIIITTILNLITLITYLIYTYFLLIFFLFIIDLLVTVFFIVFSLTSIGFKKRIKVYNDVISILPNCNIIEAYKSLGREYVIYKFKFNRTTKKMDIEYSSGSQHQAANYEISMYIKSIFDLYIWKIENEIFETDNKNFLKFKYILNDLDWGEEIVVDHYLNTLHAKALNKKNVNKIILILIEILKESEKEGKPIPRNMMSNDFSYWFGPRKYTACLNCEEIIGKWTKKEKFEIYKCPKCLNDTVGIISFVGRDVRPKMKIIKILVDK